jgi:tRNA A37 N6-isopentenylltransferase MiaA
VVEYLQGLRDLESAIEQTKLDVRHYAKRQLTWFRHEVGVEWFAGFGADAAIQDEVLQGPFDSRLLTSDCGLVGNQQIITIGNCN